SINYDMDDYAATVVDMLKEFCDRQDIPHPHIFSESGRAMTAHHALLVVQVTDVERHNDAVPQIDPAQELPEVLANLVELLGDSDPEMVAESYWRATHYIEEVA